MKSRKAHGTSGMSSSEVDDLFIKYRQSRDPVLRDKITNQFTPLVYKIANKMRTYAENAGNIIDPEDLAGYGFIGLLQAIDRYDPTKNNTFMTFAYWRIRGEIVDNIRSLSAINKRCQLASPHIQAFRDDFIDIYGVSPLYRDYRCVDPTMDFKTLIFLVDHVLTGKPLSLDTPISSNPLSPSFSDVLEDDRRNSMEDNHTEIIYLYIINKLNNLFCFSLKEKVIIALVVLYNIPISQVIRRYKVSTTHVRDLVFQFLMWVNIDPSAFRVFNTFNEPVDKVVKLVMELP